MPATRASTSRRLIAGTRVDFEGPYRIASRSRTCRHLATSSSREVPGIAPLRSMVRQLVAGGQRRADLARLQRAPQPRIRSPRRAGAARRREADRLLLTVTGEEGDWPGERGRIGLATSTPCCPAALRSVSLRPPGARRGCAGAAPHAWSRVGTDTDRRVVGKAPQGCSDGCSARCEARLLGALCRSGCSAASGALLHLGTPALVHPCTPAPILKSPLRENRRRRRSPRR